MNAPTMPEWPEPIEYTMECNKAKAMPSPKVSVVELLHERARAEAALARLRVAVEALRKIQVSAPIDPAKRWLSYDEIGAATDEALALIGEVPKP